MNMKNSDSRDGHLAQKSVYRPRINSLFWVTGAVFALIFCFFDVNIVFNTQEYAVCSQSGDIYTVDELNPRVECFVVRGSYISDTGSYEEIQSRGVDLSHSTILSLVLRIFKRRLAVFHVNPGSVVVPGLADAHAHIIDNGFKMQLILDDAMSVSDVVDRVKDYILSHPDVHNDTTRWIEGAGWDQTKWPGGQFPTSDDLAEDPILQGRPISLRRTDFHAVWVSPRVLELMGDLPSKIDGGVIVRDSDGNPTGIFMDNAMSLVPRPEWTEQQMLEYFNITMKHSLANGLTSIHDAASEPAMIALFQKQAESGNLPIRVYAMGSVLSDKYWGSQIPRLVNHGKNGRLNVRSVKLFVDGALGSWGAALLEPYSDKRETSGIMLNTPDALSKLVRQFWKDGWQVNIHCIGDRANNVVLDIFEDILEGRDGHDEDTGNATERRPRIEHAQIMTAQDLERTGRLGVIASVQPTHATSDMWYAENRLGPDRVRGAYAYRKLLEASQINVLPLGSDFPVEGVNPLLGFYAAVSRLSIDGESPHGDGGWFPEQRLTRAQALKGMTLDPAYASFAEHELGSLVPGKKADFVLLDQDIMTVPFDEILKAKVAATVIDGKVAYGAL